MLKILICWLSLIVIGKSEWILKFEDNFNSFNQNNWSAEDQVVRHQAINSKNQIRVENSNLIISANTINNTHYTGILSSKDKIIFNQGYIEVRAKVKPVEGAWIDFWMISLGMFDNQIERLSNDIHQEQEVDIFEIRKIDSNGLNISHGVFRCIHSNFYKDLEKHCECIFTPNLNINDLNYHTFGFYRDDYIYVFYVDGKEISRSSRISNKPMYMLFSIEILDNYWAGNIPNNGYSGDYLWVDYVKYWENTEP